MNKWKVGIVLGLVGVYLLGIVSGFVLQRVRWQRKIIASLQRQPSARARTRFLMQALQLTLDLTRRQRQQIEPLAARLIRQRWPHAQTLQRQTHAHRVAFLREIKPLLQPHQQKIWARLYAKYGRAPAPPKRR